MTLTLQRERRKKFEEIIKMYVAPKGLICSLEFLVDKLAEASLSRSERATDETPAEYNAELFRGDWREYPEHLWKFAETLRDTWKMTLPAKPQKKNGKGQYSFWVSGMESLKQSCAEFGADVLVKVHEDWRAGFKAGIAPYTVANPNSLVNMCAAKAIELRQIGENVRSDRKEYQRITIPEETYVPNPNRKNK